MNQPENTITTNHPLGYSSWQNQSMFHWEEAKLFLSNILGRVITVIARSIEVTVSIIGIHTKGRACREKKDRLVGENLCGQVILVGSGRC